MRMHIGCFFLTLFLLTSSLFAGQGVYLAGFLGTNYGVNIRKQRFERTYKKGYVSSVALGMHLPRAKLINRIEVEYAYRRNRWEERELSDLMVEEVEQVIKRVKGQPYALLCNCYLSLPNMMGFYPYIGGGIGKAHMKRVSSSDSEEGEESQKVKERVYQGIAGVSLSLTQTFDLFGEYRYTSISGMHGFGIGLRRYF